MGCGISKSELDETGHAYQIRGRTITRTIEENEDEPCSSSANLQRKSVSSGDGGAFFRRVLGSSERERGVERDVLLDSNDHNLGLKSIPLNQRIKNHNDNHNDNSLYLGTMEKGNATKGKIDDKQKVEKQQQAINGDQEEYVIRPRKVEPTLLNGPGSPSFRVYCAHTEFSPSTIGEDGDEEGESDKLKGPEAILVMKRGKRARGLRNAMHKGGSALGLKSVFVAKAASATPPK